MKLVRNISMGVFLGVATLLMFSKSAYAKVDIGLEDNKEEKTLTINVNSNGSYVEGVDLSVVFSDNIEILNIQQTDEFCTIGKSNKILPDNQFSLECFNDSNVEMSGMFATVSYNTQESDYFFYADEESLDIGSLTLGEVSNVNKPVITETEDDEVAEAIDLSTLEKARDFLTDNSLYVLAVVIFIIACVVAVVGFSSKKEFTE
ncbi:MAG: hypothetical protein AB9915_02105 [Candidatus Dojkabacteria bacterium]